MGRLGGPMRYRMSLFHEEGFWRLLVEPWLDTSPVPSTAASPANGLSSAVSRLVSTPIMLLPVDSYVPPSHFFREIETAVAQFAPSAEREQPWVEGPALVLAWPESACPQDRLFRSLGSFASPERFGRPARAYADLVFRTPLYKLNALGRGLGATVLVKLESMEPGSVKDRAVMGMIRAAIDRGDLSAANDVVEASSGNVAYALAAILQAEFGKKPLIFMSHMHGPVKARAVRSAGCPVIMTPASAGSHGAKTASVEYAEATGAWQLNQHGNPDNPETHRHTTGPELFHQCCLLTGQEPAEFVSGMGSGGTAVGVAMFRDDIGATFKVIGVEPSEASLLTGGSFKAHGFSGIAPGFVTPIVERDGHRIDAIETVDRTEGYAICRRLLTEEGLLVGPSSGASIAVALRRAALPENKCKTIITIAHDRGDRYLDIDGLFDPPTEAFEAEVEEFLRRKLHQERP